MINGPLRPPYSSLPPAMALNYNYSSYGAPYMPVPLLSNQQYPGPAFPSASVPSPGQNPLYSYNMGSPRVHIRTSETETDNQSAQVEPNNLTVSSTKLDSSTASEGPLDVNDLKTTTASDSPDQKKTSDDLTASVGPPTGSVPQIGASPLFRSPVLSLNVPQLYAPIPPQSIQPQQTTMRLNTSTNQQPQNTSGLCLSANQIVASSNSSDQAKQISLLLSELDAAKAQSKMVNMQTFNYCLFCNMCILLPTFIACSSTFVCSNGIWYRLDTFRPLCTKDQNILISLCSSLIQHTVLILQFFIHLYENTIYISEGITFLLEHYTNFLKICFIRMNYNGDNMFCVWTICRHKFYHFTVANTCFTAPLMRHGKTKSFKTVKWYNICQQIILS